MDFKTHLETAWKSFLNFIAPLIIMTLVTIAVGLLTFGILAPVAMAGYMHSIILMLREGREPKMQDIFSQMRLFLPLFGFGIIVFILVLIGFSLLVVPGIIVILSVSYCCLYMLLLMTDKNLGLMDSIKGSYSMTTQGNMVDNIAVFIIFAGMLAIGASTFIGSLFTQPLATIFLISVYEEKISQKQRDTLEETKEKSNKETS